MAILWDPLDRVNESQEQIFSFAKKREIQNILKSYVGFYDAFCELLQNAMDAVDTRWSKTDGDTPIDKHIWIEINLLKNSLSVTDNGIGFKPAEFKSFLAPNVTFKSGTAKTRGKKGVGATFLAYGFNYLQAGTKTPEYTIVTEMKDGRQWVDDRDNVVTRPQVADSEPLHSAFAQIDRGSTFTIRFGSEARPKDLRWIGATTAVQWRSVLLSKTPLGQLSLGDDHTPIRFDLRVVDESGAVTELVDQEASYLYPHKVVRSVANLKDVLAERQKRIDRNLDPGRLSAKFSNLNGVYFEWDTEGLKKLLSREKEEFADLIQRYTITAYGFFCYTIKIWDTFNDDTLKLRKGLRMLRGGLQLATDRMIQGDLLVIPLTNHTGYQNQSHVVVHFANADPDLGRKGFQPELREVAEAISVSAVGFLRQWRHILAKNTGAAPSIVGETELASWIQQQEAHERARPLRIANPNFFAPLHEISVTSEPQCEQDVIVLFNQLIAGGVIRGITLLAASQTERYDAVFRYTIRPPVETHLFDRVTNPLGVQEITLDVGRGFISNARILEYKYNIDALIQDFENDVKQERDIHLAVAWNIGAEWRKRYSVVSFLDLENLHARQCHGITHAFHDQMSGDLRFHAIILSELVTYLNGVDEVQAHHKKYSDAEE